LFVLAATVLATPSEALWPTDHDKAQLWGDEALPARQVVTCEDGDGGSFVIAETGTGNGRRVRVQRINHAGRALWEPEGRAISLIATTDYEFLPLSACPDGKGGVYYTSVIYDRGVYRLALNYLSEDGDRAHAHLDEVSLPTDAALVASAGGDAILVGPEPSTGTLYAARFDSTLIAVPWNVTLFDPFEFPGTGPFAEDCIAAVSDGNGGVLVAAARAGSGPSPAKVVFQRVTHDGIVPFPVNGVVVDSIQTSISDVHIEAAELDAAYVVVQDAGLLEAHHVSGGGLLDWASPVLLHNTAVNIFMEVDVSSDGIEGLLSVASDGDLHINHLDPTGNELWGPGGLPVSVTQGVETQPRLVQADWAGGILTWINAAAAQPDPVRHLAAMRFDYDGVTVWSRLEIFREDGVREPALLRAVPDLSGGVHLAWTNDRMDLAAGRQDVWAMGITAWGEPPIPHLEYIAPAAGEYGQARSVTLVGDYLDVDTSYWLQHQTDSYGFGVGNLVTIDRRAVEGWIEPRQVAVGDYHASIWDGPVQLDQLEYAWTLGPLPGCDTVNPMTVLGNTLDYTMKLDDQGDLHLAWLEPTAGSDFDLHYQKRSAGIWGATIVVDTNLGTSARPSMAIDASYAAHIAYVVVPTYPNYRIRAAIVEADGGSRVIETWHDATYNTEPRLVIDPGGTTHVVFVSWNVTADARLVHSHYDGGGAGGPDLIFAEPGYISHELSAGENGAILAYERLDELPLYTVAYRKLDHGTWGEEAILETGAWIGLPDVAWDGQDRVLFMWHRYRYEYDGSLLGMRVEEAGALGDLRSLYTPFTNDGFKVVSSGPQRFYLATQQMPLTGQEHSEIRIQRGNGLTFGPAKVVHAGGYPNLFTLSASPGHDHVIAGWNHASGKLAWECDDLGRQATAATPPPRSWTTGLTTHPNPFNARTLIRLELAEGGRMTLDLFDLRGRKVARLADGEYPSGPHEVPLVTGEATGLDLASGVYLLDLRVDGRQEGFAKVVLVK
jgi:hypothetical protein